MSITLILTRLVRSVFSVKSSHFFRSIQSNLTKISFTCHSTGLPTIRQSPFTVNPGDSFISKFWFNSENGTKFGIGSYEEMNKAIFLYYPAKKLLQTSPWSCTYDIPLGACNASMTSRVLTSTKEFERVFGGVPSSCQARTEPTKTDTSTGSDTGSHPGCLYFYTFAVCLFMHLLAF